MYSLINPNKTFKLIICNNIKTAEILYEKIDGLEFEHSSNRLDVRDL